MAHCFWQPRGATRLRVAVPVISAWSVHSVAPGLAPTTTHARSLVHGHFMDEIVSKRFAEHALCFRNTVGEALAAVYWRQCLKPFRLGLMVQICDLPHPTEEISACNRGEAMHSFHHLPQDPLATSPSTSLHVLMTLRGFCRSRPLRRCGSTSSIKSCKLLPLLLSLSLVAILSPCLALVSFALRLQQCR